MMIQKKFEVPIHIEGKRRKATIFFATWGTQGGKHTRMGGKIADIRSATLCFVVVPETGVIAAGRSYCSVEDKPNKEKAERLALERALEFNFDRRTRRWIWTEYFRLSQRDEPFSRNCQFCDGLKGGVPGNENIIDGVVVCDYCTSLLIEMKHARDLAAIDAVVNPAEQPLRLCPYHTEHLSWDQCTDGFEGCQVEEARRVHLGLTESQ